MLAEPDVVVKYFRLRRIKMKSEILTKSDVEKIKEEIRHRKLEVRPKALEDVKTAKGQGDLSENFEYYAAKKFNRENNSRIDYLEKMLKFATIIDDDDNGGVSLNNTVVVRFVEETDEETWEEERYKIVTSIRSNSMQNKVSIESPIGKALLGKKVGDIVKVVLEKGGGYELKIMDIIKEDIGEDSIKQF